MIDNSPVEWDLQEDREILAQFLRTRTGQRLLPKVLESAPILLAGGDINSILIRSGEVRGFGTAVSALLTLSVVEAAPPEEQNANLYPNLHDDTQWTDGRFLRDNNPPSDKP